MWADTALNSRAAASPERCASCRTRKRGTNNYLIMKKYFSLLLLLALFSSNSYGQRHVIDSLITVLHRQKEGSNKVQTLNELGWYMFVTKPDTAIILSIDALDLARRIKFKEGEASSLDLIGLGYNTLGNYPKALELFLQELRVWEQLKDSSGMASAYNSIGRNYTEQEDFRQAVNNLLKAKSLAKRGDVFANLGSAYRQLKMYDSARVYLQQALDIAYQYKQPRIMGWFLSELGYLNTDIGEYPLALTYLRMSIPLSAQVEDYLGLSLQYIGIAKVFEKTGQLDSSFYYAKEALVLAKQNKIAKQALEASSFLASLYQNEHNADSAFHYIVMAKAINDSLFSQQKLQQLQSMSFDEKLRQQEKEETERQTKEERAYNLQYAAIALGLVTFFIFFLLFSHSVIANQKLIKFLGILTLLITFEFLNLLLHPFLAVFMHHQPLLMLAAMVFIATLLIPLHHKMEHWVTHKLVEKNNRIRLAAAKKTIEKLEGLITNAQQ